MLACLTWLFVQNRWRMGFPPPGLHVHHVLYAKEKAWGLGPGGHATAIFVYRLPSETAAKVNAGGATYLARLGGSGRNLYGEWRATPVDSGPIYTSPPLTAHVCDLICRGPDQPWGIGLDPKVVRVVDQVLAHPGAYYASSSVGVLIVAPQIRQAVFIRAR